MIKVLNEKELRLRVLTERNKGSDVVTTNGVFDLLHYGHIHSLEKARNAGDFLIVGLNSDASVRRHKYENGPVFNETERAMTLAGLQHVDAIYIFPEDDPTKFLDIVKPKWHVKSREGFKGLERGVVERNGGQILLIDDIGDYGSDRIYKALRERHG